jgi:hypothetical protein
MLRSSPPGMMDAYHFGPGRCDEEVLALTVKGRKLCLRSIRCEANGSHLSHRRAHSVMVLIQKLNARGMQSLFMPSFIVKQFSNSVSP